MATKATPSSPTRLAGTVIAYRIKRGGHIGVLLRGKPGSGKSSLALQAIRHTGARLIGDDAVIIKETRCGLRVQPVPQFSGLLHVAGVGLAPMPCLRAAPLGLVIDLVAQDKQPHLPPRTTRLVLGHRLPYLRLAPFDLGAAARLELAAHHIASCGFIANNAILSSPYAGFKRGSK